MAHWTSRQSMSPIMEEIVSFTENRPLDLYGIARSRPYGGGVEEIHAEDGSLAVMFTPPPHGDGC